MYDFMDIDDWMIIGPLSEELANERERQELLEQEFEEDERLSDDE